MNSFAPLVSIIIPVYNGSNFLKEAIDSALAQTYANIEVIVINDGSIDGGETEKIALSYGERIRYYSKPNGGVSTALNLGIEKMNGEYFSWLSHDDKYTPHKIENQINALNEFYDEKLLILCRGRAINASSEFIKKRISKRKLNFNQVYSANEALINMFNEGTFGGCSFLVPKIAFAESGSFNEKLRFSQDAFMWSNIFLNGYKLLYIDRVDVYSRVHNGQLTQTGQSIYHSDCLVMSEYLIPTIIQKDKTKHYKIFFAYTKLNCKMNNSLVAQNCIKSAKVKKLFTFFQKVNLFFVSIFGKMRPTIRKLYYKIFFRINTK